MKKKTILILLRRYKGGVGSYSKNVKKELEKLNLKVELISREDDLNLNSFISSIFKIREFVLKKDPDLIYTQDWSLALPLLFPTSIFKEKHFCCFHGESPKGMDRILQLITGLRMNENLIVVSQRLKKIFSKSTYIAEGIDPTVFKPLNKKRKGIGYANYKNSIYNFDIISEACKELNKELIVAENLSSSQMNLFYNKIETFISLPPTYTGFGLVWIEAMAAGVPKVIGSNSGIGLNLPIEKVNGFSPDNEKIFSRREKIDFIKQAILNSKKKDYSKWIKEKKYYWKDHVLKLSNIFKKEKK